MEWSLHLSFMPYSNPIIRRIKQKERSRKNYLKNKEKVLIRTDEYRRNNLQYYAGKQKAWRNKHSDEVSLYKKKYNLKKYQTDLIYRLRVILRSRIVSAMKGNQKVGSAVRDLGCSIEEFKKYIESKFTEGMSWQNYGEWHLDHIKPLASFDLINKEEFLKACHYTNYQPLWAEDNYKKADKL